jgi:hypothetical protein
MGLVMGEIVSVRASFVPLVEKCPAAAIPPGIAIEDNGDEARLGTGVHEITAIRVDSSDEYRVDFDETAKRLDIDQEELGMLCNMAWGQWCRELSPWFPEPQTEVEMTERPLGELGKFTLTGHADVMAIAQTELRVLDWKTGRLEMNHVPQLKAYSLLGMLKTGLQSARACVVRVRFSEADWYAWDLPELLDWWAEIESKAGKEIYNPGANCRYCPRRYECPARREQLRSSMSFIGQDLEPKEAFIEEAARGTYLALLEVTANDLIARCKEIREYVKAELGGEPRKSLPMVDGRALMIKETDKRTVEWSEAARGILSNYLSPDAITRTLKCSKTSVEEEVKAIAPYRQKTALCKEVVEMLDSAGCLKTSTSETVCITKPQLEHQK